MGLGKWATGIDKVLDVIGSVDTILGTAAGAATVAVGFKSSVCAKDAAVALIGTDIFTPIQDLTPTLLDFASSFKEMIVSMLDALLSDVWETTQGVLQKVVDDSQGIVAALNPLQPLRKFYQLDHFALISSCAHNF